jgi:hypothetical protein
LKMLRFKRSRSRLKKRKLQDSVLMSKARYSTRSAYVSPKLKESKNCFCENLMTPPTLFTQEVPRCTMILRADIGDME